MDGIEISFPVQVCKDVLENLGNCAWRSYQASISSGKKGAPRVGGGLKTRVVSDADGFVEMIITFPRNAIKCPAVRGKLYCKAEGLTVIGDNKDKLDTAVAEISRNESSAEAATKRHQIKDISVVHLNDAKTSSVQKQSESLTLPSRPTRKRETPARFKEYVSLKDDPIDSGSLATNDTADFTIKAANLADVLSQENIQIQEAESSPNDPSRRIKYLTLSVTSSPNSLQKTASPRHETALHQEASTPVIEEKQSQPKRFVRKYDKLIQNLQQAAANTGKMMKMVISDYNTEADSTAMDQGNASLRTWTSFQRKFPSSLMCSEKELNARKLELTRKSGKTTIVGTLVSAPCAPSADDIGEVPDKPDAAVKGSPSDKNPRPIIRVPDHDYTGFQENKKKSQFSDRPLRTLIKPISLTRHIQARVEKVEEGEGSSLVTISGLNTNRLDSSRLPAQYHTEFNHEGFPIVQSLDDAMTNTIRMRQKDRESYITALQAAPTPVEEVNLPDMRVVSEVIISNSGRLPRNLGDFPDELNDHSVKISTVNFQGSAEDTPGTGHSQATRGKDGPVLTTHGRQINLPFR